MLDYLPDNPSEENVSRDYLFTVVNTLDPTFFERLHLAVKTSIQTEKPEKSQRLITVDESMFNLLQKVTKEPPIITNTQKS